MVESSCLLLHLNLMELMIYLLPSECPSFCTSVCLLIPCPSEKEIVASPTESRHCCPKSRRLFLSHSLLLVVLTPCFIVLLKVLLLVPCLLRVARRLLLSCSLVCLCMLPWFLGVSSLFLSFLVISLVFVCP